MPSPCSLSITLTSRMRMRHSIGSKQPVIRSNILSPPRGTQKEFNSPKLATTRVSKGKSSMKSIPGIGKPSPSTMKKTQALPKETRVPTGSRRSNHQLIYLLFQFYDHHHLFCGQVYGKHCPPK